MPRGCYVAGERRDELRKQVAALYPEFTLEAIAGKLDIPRSFATTLLHETDVQPRARGRRPRTSGDDRPRPERVVSNPKRDRLREQVTALYPRFKAAAIAHKLNISYKLARTLLHEAGAVESERNRLRDRLVVLYPTLSLRQIARELDITYSFAQILLHETNLQPRSRGGPPVGGRSKFSEEEYEELRTQVGKLCKTMPLKAVAKELDISFGTAKKMLHETGVQPRPR